LLAVLRGSGRTRALLLSVAPGVSPDAGPGSLPGGQKYSDTASAMESHQSQKRPRSNPGREIRTGVWTCRFAAADAALYVRRDANTVRQV